MIRLVLGLTAGLVIALVGGVLLVVVGLDAGVRAALGALAARRPRRVVVLDVALRERPEARRAAFVVIRGGKAA